MTGPRPLQIQRSPWVPVDLNLLPEAIGGVAVLWYRRYVNDGTLYACVADEPQGWHMSVSFRDKRNKLSRYPRWDELTHARYHLLPADIDVVMHLPPPTEYVAVHDTTFHLHQHPERTTTT